MSSLTQIRKCICGVPYLWISGRGIGSRKKCYGCRPIDVLVAGTCSVCGARMAVQSSPVHAQPSTCQVCRRREKPNIEHLCKVCGKVFFSRNVARVVCSTKCNGVYQQNIQKLRPDYQGTRARDAKKSAKRRYVLVGQTIETVISEKVFDRDNWICQLCDGPVNRDDPVYAKRPTLDHIIPLSAGGAHSYENVQLAHFGCNSSKGGSR